MEASATHQRQSDTFVVTGMTCASCASSVETVLTYTPGVQAASVNLSNNTVKIDYSPEISPEELNQALQEIGYGLVISDKTIQEAAEDEQTKTYARLKLQTIGAAILTLPVFVIGMFFMDWQAGRWISMILSFPVLFYFGGHFFLNAWKQAKNGKVSMDALVALSTGIAYAYSVFNTLYPEFLLQRGMEPHLYFEAATVIITFISLGKLLEEKAKSSTATSLKKLMGLQPKTLTRITDGKAEEIPIEAVRKNDFILVKPGEKIPVDGKVIEGQSFVDESMISGEPLAIQKNIDDSLFAGTINQKGSLKLEATAVGKETILAQIISRVQEAQGSKAPVQKLADKIAGIFVPIVLVISLVTFLTWILLGGSEAFTDGFLAAIAVLVIACPCALGLATPTAVMVGIGKGAENNILIRDAESLELAHQVDTIVLDKTGTITKGKPKVTASQWIEKLNSSQIRELSSVLLALETQSEHPLAAAITEFISEQNPETVSLSQFQSITGRGILAHWEGSRFLAGNRALLEEENIPLPQEIESFVQDTAHAGQTLVYFAKDENALAVFSLTDPIKPSSKEAIQELIDAGIEVHMLTGDQEGVANQIAQETGITHVRAGVLPSQKGDYVKALKEKGRIIAMVGDGINDSEALALADVSIAMGHGSDVAMDVAKITLITSDLKKIPQAIRLSKLTVRGIRQNLFWAFIYNVIGIPIAAGILYPINGFLLDPMIAGIAMAFSSVSVVSNSLLLRRKPI